MNSLYLPILIKFTTILNTTLTFPAYKPVDVEAFLRMPPIGDSAVGIGAIKLMRRMNVVGMASGNRNAGGFLGMVGPSPECSSMRRRHLVVDEKGGGVTELVKKSRL